MRTVLSVVLGAMVLVALVLPPVAECADRQERKSKIDEMQRMKAEAVDGRFYIGQDGTVADLKARLLLKSGETDTRDLPDLMWQQETAGGMKWKKAISYCEELTLAGYKNWRLPTRAELMSLVVDKRARPKINLKVFPDTKSARYWTGVPKRPKLPGTEDQWGAYFVDFKKGREGYFHDHKKYQVRCVRAIQ